MKLKRLSLFLALVMILSAFAGTFTISSAATTAGGTFEIWRAGVKVSQAATSASYTNTETDATTIDAAIGAGTIKDGDTVKLTSNYASTAVEQTNMKINLTIDGQDRYTISNKGTGSSGRLFNVGGPGNDPTSAVITVTFKNLTMYSTNSLVQINSVKGTAVFDNVDMTAAGNTNILVMTKDNSTITLKNGSTLYTNGIKFVLDADSKTEGNQMKNQYAVFYMGAAGDTVNIENSTVTVASPTYAVVRVMKNNQTVNFNGATMIGEEFKGAGTWVSGFVNQDDGTTGLTVNVTNGSVMDGSRADYFRLMYLRANSTLNLSDCVFYGSAGSHDIMQVNVATTVEIGKNVVFAGGGSATAGTVGQIIRNYSTDGTNATPICYDFSASNPYNVVKIMNRNAQDYASDEELLTAMLGKIAFTGSNYDAVAASMGYSVRIGTAEAAYAEGKFTGYYHSINDAVTYGGASYKNNTYYIIGDSVIGSSTIAMESASDTFTIEGVKKTNGQYPNLYHAGGGMFNFTYGKNLGTTTLKNLNIIATGDKIAQVNTGWLVFDNCTIDQRTSNYGFVIQGKDANAANTDANTAAGEIRYYGKLKLKDTTIVVGTNTHVLRYNSEYCTAVIENSTIVHNGTTASPVYVMKNGMLDIDANSEFVISGKTPFTFETGMTLTLNGKAVTSPITAGAMLDGASVRVARAEAGQEELSNSGIRFESTLTAAQVTAAKAAGATTVEYGTVIFRYEDLDGMSVAELVAAANASDSDELKVAEIRAEKGKVGSDAEGYTIRAALVNIKTNHYDTQFGAVAYIELTYANGSTMRIYGDFDATKNVRSIKSVAEAALKDTKTQAQIDENGSATFEGYVYHNEIATGVFSCYSDEQIAILKTYAGVQ